MAIEKNTIIMVKNNQKKTIFHFNTTSLQSVKIGLVMVGTYIKMKYTTAN